LGQASDSRALAVAARENSVSLESAGKLDRSIQRILLDLGQDYKLNQSLEFAHTTGQSFKNTLTSRYDYRLPDLRVKQAPFYVLLNSNMPSILAEVAYISNSDEERLLRNDRYRQALAESLYEGLRRYLSAIEPAS
jgi:N-acetylmuramoyl-L-alanine amidase